MSTYKRGVAAAPRRSVVLARHSLLVRGSVKGSREGGQTSWGPGGLPSTHNLRGQSKAGPRPSRWPPKKGPGGCRRWECEVGRVPWSPEQGCCSTRVHYNGRAGQGWRPNFPPRQAARSSWPAPAHAAGSIRGRGAASYAHASRVQSQFWSSEARCVRGLLSGGWWGGQQCGQVGAHSQRGCAGAPAPPPCCPACAAADEGGGSSAAASRQRLGGGRVRGRARGRRRSLRRPHEPRQAVAAVPPPPNAAQAGGPGCGRCRWRGALLGCGRRRLLRLRLLPRGGQRHRHRGAAAAAAVVRRVVAARAVAAVRRAPQVAASERHRAWRRTATRGHVRRRHACSAAAGLARQSEEELKKARPAASLEQQQQQQQQQQRRRLPGGPLFRLRPPSHLATARSSPGRRLCRGPACPWGSPRAHPALACRRRTSRPPAQRSAGSQDQTAAAPAPAHPCCQAAEAAANAERQTPPAQSQGAHALPLPTPPTPLPHPPRAHLLRRGHHGSRPGRPRLLRVHEGRRLEHEGRLHHERRRGPVVKQPAAAARLAPAAAAAAVLRGEKRREGSGGERRLHLRGQEAPQLRACANAMQCQGPPPAPRAQQPAGQPANHNQPAPSDLAGRRSGRAAELGGWARPRVRRPWCGLVGRAPVRRALRPPGPRPRAVLPAVVAGRAAKGHEGAARRARHLDVVRRDAKACGRAGGRARVGSV